MPGFPSGTGSGRPPDSTGAHWKWQQLPPGALSLPGRISWAGLLHSGWRWLPAVPEGLFLPALFGALFGYLWFPAPGSAMEYAAAILLLGGVRWTLSSGSLWKRVPQAPAVLAGGCMLVGGVAAAFALGR